MWCMRWQRLSVFETLASGSWALAVRRLVPSIALACLTVCGALVLAPALLPAEAEELIEDGDVDDVGPVGDAGHARHEPAREVDPGGTPAGIRDDLRCRMQWQAVNRANPADAGDGPCRRDAHDCGKHERAAQGPPGRCDRVRRGGSQCHHLRRRMRRPARAGAAAVAGFAAATAPPPRKEAEAGNEPLDVGR